MDRFFGGAYVLRRMDGGWVLVYKEEERSKIWRGGRMTIKSSLILASIASIALIVGVLLLQLDGRSLEAESLRLARLDSGEQPVKKKALPASAFRIVRVPPQKRDAGHLVPVGEASTLQAALDRYGVVRLESANYEKKGPPALVLRSGQRIYGSPGTWLPKIQVENGAHDAVLSTVGTQEISFAAGPNVTRNNTFERILGGGLKVKDSKVENNLFLDMSNSSLDVDTRNRGYFRNNRFIRFMAHGASPAISLKGDPDWQSYGNVWIWTNVMTPAGNTIYLDNQRDATFVGLDVESWNWEKKATQAMFTTGPMGKLRVMLAGGDQYLPKDQWTSIFDVGAQDFELLSLSAQRASQPGIILRQSNKAAFLLDAPGWQVKSEGKARRFSSLFANRAPSWKDFWHHDAVAADMNPAASPAWRHASFAFLPPPRFESIADPAGPNWAKDRDKKPDSTQYIQDMVDRDGIAHLPAGVYYISRPIALGNDDGILGAGAHKTAIVAKDPDMDLIVSRSHQGERYSLGHFTLGDLTLQGGRNGIHHDPEGAGGGAQFNLVYLSHVTIRDMQNAGIFIDRIMAWDNNFIDHVTFYRNGVGIKQRVDPLWLGGDKPGMSYLDKNVFYNCQFVQNGKGLELDARRQDNFNAFINTLFQDNRAYAADLHNNQAVLFLNSWFVNNGGNPSVKNNKLEFFVQSRFYGGPLSKSMIGSHAFVLGSHFYRNGRTSGRILSEPAKGFFIDNVSDMPVGKVEEGYLANNRFARNPDLNKARMVMRDGKAQVLANPGNDLLSQR